jgi:hypothetical protein
VLKNLIAFPRVRHLKLVFEMFLMAENVKIPFNLDETRVSLFRFKQKDAKRSKKYAKTNSKQARGSETKQTKVRLL